MAMSCQTKQKNPDWNQVLVFSVKSLKLSGGPTGGSRGGGAYAAPRNFFRSAKKAKNWGHAPPKNFLYGMPPPEIFFWIRHC